MSKQIYVDSIDNIMNVHNVVDIQHLSETLNVEPYVILANATQLDYVLKKLFDDYDIEDFSEDIEELIPNACVFVSEYNDIVVINYELYNEDYQQ